MLLVGVTGSLYVTTLYYPWSSKYMIVESLIYIYLFYIVSLIESSDIKKRNVKKV